MRYLIMFFSLVVVANFGLLTPVMAELNDPRLRQIHKIISEQATAISDASLTGTQEFMLDLAKYTKNRLTGIQYRMTKYDKIQFIGVPGGVLRADGNMEPFEVNGNIDDTKHAGNVIGSRSRLSW